MSKGKLVESFNQYLKDGLASNHLGSMKIFKQALSRSNGAERIEALHELLKYNNPNNLALKPAAIDSALGEAIQAILKQDPNILEHKENGVYAFADEVVNCKYQNVKDHLAEHVRRNTKDSKESILSGDSFLSARLNAQLISDPRSVVHFITTCNHYNDPRGQKLLAEIIDIVPKKESYQDIVIESLKDGMEISEEQFKKLDLSPDQLNEMLKNHIESFDTPSMPWQTKQPSQLNDKMVKQALASLKEKEGPDSKLSAKLLEKAINQNNTKLVCDMALSGFKLETSYGKYASGKTNELAKELLDNKSSFSSQELTANDQQRIVLLASSGMKKEEQAEFLKNNKGISPLKLAIDTKQYDIAAKMFVDGATLKPSELSLNLRMKNAIGMVDMKLETVKAIESNEKAKSGGFVEKLQKQRSGTQQKTH
jgi:hypothetical protein